MKKVNKRKHNKQSRKIVVESQGPWWGGDFDD